MTEQITILVDPKEHFYLIRKCFNCDNFYSGPKWEIKRRKFCSNKCVGKVYSGLKHPMHRPEVKRKVAEKVGKWSKEKWKEAGFREKQRIAHLGKSPANKGRFNGIISVCKICSEPFKTRNKKQILCSIPCKNAYQKEHPSLGMLNKKHTAEWSENHSKKMKAISSRMRENTKKSWINGKFKNRKCNFYKGMIPWNTGKKLPNMSGNKNPSWKGGITPIHLKIRNSPEYAQWRKKVFERDNHTCVICKKRNCLLNADHIKPFSKYPELRFDINNGRTLCVPCHKKTETYGGRAGRC